MYLFRLDFALLLLPPPPLIVNPYSTPQDNLVRELTGFLYHLASHPITRFTLWQLCCPERIEGGYPECIEGVIGAAGWKSILEWAVYWNDHWHRNGGMAKCLKCELVCVRVWNVGKMEFWRLRWTWKLVYIDCCCCCCHDRYSNRDLIRVNFVFQTCRRSHRKGWS